MVDICIELQLSITNCLKFCTAGWYVVTKVSFPDPDRARWLDRSSEA